MNQPETIGWVSEPDDDTRCEILIVDDEFEIALSRSPDDDVRWMRVSRVEAQHIATGIVSLL